MLCTSWEMTTQGRRWSWLRDLNYWRWELYSLIFTEAGFRNLNEIQLLSLSFPTLLKSVDRELCFEVCWVEMCLWEIPVRRADLVTGELHPSVCSFCSNHTAYSCRPLSLPPRVRNLSRLHWPSYLCAFSVPPTLIPPHPNSNLPLS